jgi:hypothetical protein
VLLACEVQDGLGNAAGTGHRERRGVESKRPRELGSVARDILCVPVPVPVELERRFRVDLRRHGPMSDAVTECTKARPSSHCVTTIARREASSLAAAVTPRRAAAEPSKAMSTGPSEAFMHAAAYGRDCLITLGFARLVWELPMLLTARLCLERGRAHPLGQEPLELPVDHLARTT